MTQLLSYWSLNWAAFSLLLLMIIVYVVVNKSFSRIVYFASAIIILVLCFFSPLQLLSAHYLFAAHMTVHVLLLLCIGPLLVVSLVPQSSLFSSFFLFLKDNPLLGWLTGVGIMWFWHVPVVFNAAMATAHHNPFTIIPIIEALSLMLAGIIFSAPVIHPNKKFRIDALAGIVYLFTACIGCSLLGLLITFAPVGTYHHFLSMHDPYRLNKIILQQWHITQATDQQAAGLIMWVPCCLIYVSGAMYLLVHWLKQKDVIAESQTFAPATKQ